MWWVIGGLIVAFVLWALIRLDVGTNDNQRLLVHAEAYHRDIRSLLRDIDERLIRVHNAVSGDKQPPERHCSMSGNPNYTAEFGGVPGPEVTVSGFGEIAVVNDPNAPITWSEIETGKKMPKVGTKKFAYTKSGEKAAKSYARESGQKVKYTQKRGK